MARIRTIKPGYFKNGDLFDAEKATGLPLRVAYAGLWTIADREGRFKWKPREIKTDVLPYDEVSMHDVLNALCQHNFILKYKVAGEEYGLIPKFLNHQHVNKNEAPSTLPAPEENSNARAETVNEPTPSVFAPSEHHEERNRKGKEQEGKEKPPSLRSGGARAREENPISKPASKKKPPSPMPEDWPNEASRAWSFAKWSESGRPDLCRGIADEIEKARSHHAKLDNRFADWSAAWRTWAMQALERKGKSDGRGKPNRLDDIARGIGDFVGADTSSPRDDATGGTELRSAGRGAAERLGSAGSLADHTRANGQDIGAAGNNLSLIEHRAGGHEPEIPSFLRGSRPPSGESRSLCGPVVSDQDQSPARVFPETSAIAGAREVI